MPQRALIFRAAISVLGLLGVALLLPLFRIDAPIEQLALLVLIAASQVWLDIDLPPRRTQRRILMLSVTFTFVAFLAFGALTATVVTVAATAIAQAFLAFRSHRRNIHPLYVTFDAARMALNGICAGLAVWALTGWSFDAPPQIWALPLLVYATTFLVVELTLTTVAARLSDGAVLLNEQRWARNSLWIALCFAICGPLALMVGLVIPQGGTRYVIIITFAALMSFRTILGVMLRYERLSNNLAIVNTVSAKLTTSLDSGTLFPAIYEGMRPLMPVDVFFIALVDDQRDVRFVYVRGKGGEIEPRSIPYRGSLIATVAHTGQTLSLDEAGATAAPSFESTSQPVRSMLVTPLIAGDRLIGALGVQSYAETAYESRQVELLKLLGGMVAIAIRNAQLFEREKAILREREEFVSLVAHELKNPLAAISGYRQIAARRVRPDDEQLQRPLQVIAEQTIKLNHLVDDLLQLSRADAGRLTLHRKATDIGQLVLDTVEQQQVQTNQHRLHVDIETPLPSVSIDSLRIGQVLQNLIGNAIKYSPDGGRIDVRVQTWGSDDARLPTHLPDESNAPAAWVVVEVQDQGVGIPERELPNVFNRFFRANNNRSGEIAGVGLGLSIASEFVRAHDGLIWVTSTLGVGSTFRFALRAGI